MIKTISNIESWLQHHTAHLQNIGLFFLAALVGTFIKIYKEPKTPNQWKISRFLSELIVSIVIAVTLYEINEQFFKFPIFFVMVFCVWGGSLSASLYSNVEQLLNSIFSNLKTFFSNHLQSLIILFSLLLFSCATPIKTINHDTKLIKRDSLIKEVYQHQIKSLAITDTVTIYVPEVRHSNNPQCDSLANQQINDLLMQLNISKASGDNQFSVIYNPKKRQLTAIGKVAESNNIQENNNTTSSKNENAITTTTIQIPVKYTPNWIKYLAGLGAVCLLLLVLFIINKITKSLKII